MRLLPKVLLSVLGAILILGGLGASFMGAGRAFINGHTGGEQCVAIAPSEGDVGYHFNPLTLETVCEFPGSVPSVVYPAADGVPPGILLFAGLGAATLGAGTFYFIARTRRK